MAKQPLKVEPVKEQSVFFGLPSRDFDVFYAHQNISFRRGVRFAADAALKEFLGTCDLIVWE